jgi:hypothetical protein
MKSAGAAANTKVQVPTYVTKASKKWCLLIFITKIKWLNKILLKNLMKN